ncbi:MAG: TldD/PmbA family protein [Deltaproteobacteria bacterium]|nr:TldD/PmbA family protein [Deltaproteobacteria bacterium]
MVEELDRNRESLRLEDFDPAYFISYSLRDTDRRYISGKSGAIFQDSSFRNSFIQADVRVGDYDMDSSEDGDALFNPSQKFVPNNMAPIEKSRIALRRALWLLTDYKYKGALLSFMKVKGKRVNDPKKRTVASMSREEPLHLVERPVPLVFDREVWRKGVRRISAALLDYPEIFDSSVEVSATRLTRYFVNTEGTVVKTVDDYYQVFVTAVTRADDGFLLEDTVSSYVRSPSRMPSPAEVEKKVRVMAGRLVEMRKAQVLEPATVPVLMSPEATGVFFHETIGHRLEGQRQEGADEGRTFKGRLGQRILPDFINVYDDPTIREWGKTPLNGSYRVDDEGVPSQSVMLVDHGVLKGFLMSRKPVEGFSRSNGHGRSDGFQRPVGRMGNLIVKGTKPVSSKRLEKMLLEEVRRQHKPYGLIIKTIAGGSTNTSSYGYQAFKGVPIVVYRVDAKTGDKRLARGVEIVGTPLSSISKIVATSDKYGVFNGYCGAESGSVPVSTVAPEMLFAEIELQRAHEGKERQPILPPPSVSLDSGAR